MSHVFRTAVPALLCLITAFVALTQSADAQTPTPRSIVTVAVAANSPAPLQGEMYWIDHQTNSWTRIVTPALFHTDRPNCILMRSPISGFVGSNPTVTTLSGNIYGFTVVANKLTLGNAGKPLNTSATAGGNISQMVIVGTTLYFVSQTAGAVGTLQSIPMAGGQVTNLYDLTTLPSTLLANALTEFAGKIFIGTWSVSSTASGELIEYTISTKKARKIMDLPFSRWKGTAGNLTYGFGCVNMQFVRARLSIAILGIYGDKLEVNAVTGKVISHTFHGPKTQPNLTNNLINSGYYDPTTNDWVMGTRRGSIERWVETGAAVGIVTGVGSHPTATSNSVNGVYHFPVATNSDITSGAGCPLSSTGLTPTDVASGAVIAGNKGFAMNLWNGPANQTFILAIGAVNTNINFGNPGCKLYLTPLLLLGGKLDAAGNVRIKVPLPNKLPKNGVAYRQWGCTDGLGGLVLSNVRKITTQ